MRIIKTVLILSVAAIFTLTVEVQNSSGAYVPKVSQAKLYERFHDVLHPLQHEALPQKNFAEIRRRSGELFTRGRAIVRLGVGQAPKRNRAEFAKVLRRFDRALTAFKADARSGSDAKLEKSFTAVHDSYEELDSLVVVVHIAGLPPSLYLSCPSTSQKAETSNNKSSLAGHWTLDFGRWTNF